MSLSIFYLISGSILLYFGSHWMVQSSVNIASKLNISKFVIGLTIVAFGTSLPELGVSLKAALFDKSAIAIGNIIGSNITNVALVLGSCSLFAPIVISFTEIKKDLLIYLIVCGLLIFFLWDQILSRFDGTILFSGLILYTIYSFKTGKAHQEEVEETPSNFYWTIFLLVLGISLIYFGSDLFINGAILFAGIIGISDIVIGLSVVALGTSLPELVTSLVASLKDEHSISVGNIIGSNLFNILSVLGLVSIITPLDIDKDIFTFEIPLMVLSGLILVPLGIRNKPLSKWISISLLCGYTIFLLALYN
ncbi:MAG: sodium:calcium antiporter [Candidatus Marinimicrobia bacterium]|nr:sodium:calcium antiporter [Candidatus Neomarinimicrobiota bacterium]|tara:strand:+ start:49493 stop:50413 length:921 start_codon:yes stop_codon:yes gene_type:complete